MKLSDFSLIKEDDENYHIGHPEGRTLQIPKKDLPKEAHEKIKTMFPDGGTVGDYEGGGSSATSAEAPPEEAPEETPEEAPAAQQEAPAAAAAAPAASPVASSAPASPAAQAPLPATSETEKAFNEERAGIIGESKAKADLSKASANVLGTKIGKMEKLPSIVDIQAKQRESDQKFQSAMETGKIDPNRYVSSMGVGSKIAAGIGMVLGGLGQGLIGGKNPAYEFLNDQINRDIDAQKNAQGNTMNLWKMNREATQSDIAATVQTQNQMYNVLKFKLEKATADAGTPAEQARGQQALGQLDQKIAQTHAMQSALGMTKESTGGAPAGSEQAFTNHLRGLQVYYPEFYKEEQSKYLPGIGIARKPLAQADSDTAGVFDNMQKTIDRAKHFQSTIGTTYNPYSTESGTAKAIQGDLELQMKQLYHSQRFDERSAAIYKELVADPSAFWGAKAKQHLSELETMVNSKNQSFQKIKGIDPFVQPHLSDEKAANFLQKAGPNDPQAQRIKQILNAKGKLPNG